MKSIIICCSISASDKALEVQRALESMGFTVEIPFGVRKYRDNNFTHVAESERAKDKKENDLIKRYYEQIKEYDAVLVVNTEKNGIDNYIGANTFLEMGFAHVLGKQLCVLNPVPESGYQDEIDAMTPIVLNGNLELLKKLQ